MTEIFSKVVPVVTEGNTVPSIDILGNKTFVDIGSGTVLKLYWDTPIAQNNAIDYYTLYLYTYDNISNLYQTIIKSNIGNVNEFYINSSLLTSVKQDHYQLYIQLTANSKYGEAYSVTSEVITVNISKGCGTYVKADRGYPQPIMKRALAFARLGYEVLTDAEGVALKDSEGKLLYVKVARAQDTEIGWSLMQEFCARDSESFWQNSDIQYEILTNEQGEIITDINNEPIYVL